MIRGYETIGATYGQAMTWIEESSFFGPEFSPENLRVHMRLQSWSLKPARQTARPGPYVRAGALAPIELAIPKD